MRKREYIIAVDFDGTIVTHEYPKVGQPVPFAKEVINMLVENGHKCFLWTMRDNGGNGTIEQAIKYCTDNDIKLCSYNASPEQFSDSPKQYATLYIDDAALGCPLILNYDMANRPFVDWYKVAKQLAIYGLITVEQFNSLKIN